MENFRRNAFPILALVLSFPAVSALAVDPASMKRAFQSLMNLQVLALTPERLADPEAKAAAEADLDQLLAVKHDFGKKEKLQDPALGATLSAFTDHVREARAELHAGNTSYARYLIRSTGGFCFGCHTRLSSADFQDASRRVESMAITPFRKAEFFAVSRQFDRALDIYKNLLNEKPDTALDAVEYGRALRHYVLLQVRVKQDPDGLAHSLQKLTQRKDLPQFVRALVEAWRSDVVFWRDHDRLVVADLTGSALLREGKRLLARGQSLRSFPQDGNGEVSFLRATGCLHEALGRGLSGTERGEALYLLGTGYQALEDPSYAGLDRAFFEACVRENPRTEIARKCFRSYLREALRQGDTISDASRKRTGELRSLIE